VGPPRLEQLRPGPVDLTLEGKWGQQQVAEPARRTADRPKPRPWLCPPTSRAPATSAKRGCRRPRPAGQDRVAQTQAPPLESVNRRRSRARQRRTSRGSNLAIRCRRWGSRLMTKRGADAGRLLIWGRGMGKSSPV
jgi:hypothetical protein